MYSLNFGPKGHRREGEAERSPEGWLGGAGVPKSGSAPGRGCTEEAALCPNFAGEDPAHTNRGAFA